MKPRPISSSPHSGQLQHLQGEIKFKLGSKHQILRAITAVRDMGLGNTMLGFQAQSFDRLSRNIKSSSGIRPTVVTDGAYSRVSPTSSQSRSQQIARAAKIQVITERANWIKGHGKDTGTQPSSEAAKTLFNALKDSEDVVNCGALIGHLLTIGLADNAKDLKTAFEVTFSCANVYHFNLDEALFSSLFQSKKVIDKIIEVLASKETDVYNRDSLSNGRPSTTSAVHLQWVFPTFTRSMRIITGWWNDINPNKSEYIHIRKLADYLVVLGIVGNRHEGQRLVHAIGKLCDEVYVSQPNYYRLFYPALLKAAVVNLAVGMSSGGKKSDASVRLKMADLERKVMLSGLKAKKNTAQDKTAFAAYSDFVKVGRTFQQRSKPLDTGKVTLIPSITNEWERSLTPTSKLWMNQSRSPTRTRIYDDLSECSLESQTPRSHSHLKYFKLTNTQLCPREAKLQRDTLLHQHFEHMVEFASELDHVLAGCRVLG